MLLRIHNTAFVFIFILGCSQGDERLAEKARIEGRETAMAELQVQSENIELLLQRARAEARAQAEAELNTQNDNLTEKSQQMEADLATRQLFYQAIRGTYEGALRTER